MPVRKIPKNYLFVTGGYASQKNKMMDGFESLMEKDYMLLLDFDETVASFEAQPVRIPVPGIKQGYVPDVLVKYRPSPITGEVPKSLLAEVKHTDELKRNQHKYVEKFAAAHEYAEQLGWIFSVVDQTQIRIPKLANLKFLREYRNIEPDQNEIKWVLEKAWSLPKLFSSQTLFSVLACSDDERLHWMPIVWHMVLMKYLVADLDRQFGSDVALQLSEVMP